MNLTKFREDGMDQKIIDEILFVRGVEIRIAVIDAAARFARHRHRIVRTVGKQNHRVDTTEGQRGLQRLLRTGVAGEIIDPRAAFFVKDVEAFGIVPGVAHAVVFRVDAAADVVAVNVQRKTVFRVELFHQIFAHPVVRHPMAPPARRGPEARNHLLPHCGRKRDCDIRLRFAESACPRAHGGGKTQQEYNGLDKYPFHILHSDASLRVYLYHIRADLVNEKECYQTDQAACCSARRSIASADCR